MVSSTKPRAIGFNHVALEVGDIEEALEFYSRIFDFQLRGKSEAMVLHRSQRPIHRVEGGTQTVRR